ncbi:unnamed protein product [Protopolystoma xenopodis]|uniref:Uncharacterized protein n=1 Tax=Protopolystoma xenopodis TaxID=117903 RepID=A0A448WAW1_9PLAT|nr:unnamed protein product [Protopolystoma xenopodis]
MVTAGRLFSWFSIFFSYFVKYGFFDDVRYSIDKSLARFVGAAGGSADDFRTIKQSPLCCNPPSVTAVVFRICNSDQRISSVAYFRTKVATGEASSFIPKWLADTRTLPVDASITKIPHINRDPTHEASLWQGYVTNQSPSRTGWFPNFTVRLLPPTGAIHPHHQFQPHPLPHSFKISNPHPSLQAQPPQPQPMPPPPPPPLPPHTHSFPAGMTSTTSSQSTNVVRLDSVSELGLIFGFCYYSVRSKVENCEEALLSYILSVAFFNHFTGVSQLLETSSNIHLPD